MTKKVASKGTKAKLPAKKKKKAVRVLTQEEKLQKAVDTVIRSIEPDDYEGLCEKGQKAVKKLLEVSTIKKTLKQKKFFRVITADDHSPYFGVAGEPNEDNDSFDVVVTATNKKTKEVTTYQAAFYDG